MTSIPRSPGRIVAESAIRSIRRAGYCDEAIARFLESDPDRFGKLCSGRARFRDRELELIEYATERTAYDWALAGTFEPRSQAIETADSRTTTEHQLTVGGRDPTVARSAPRSFRGDAGESGTGVPPVAVS